jgi:hypothetical protein
MIVRVTTAVYATRHSASGLLRRTYVARKRVVSDRMGGADIRKAL